MGKLPMGVVGQIYSYDPTYRERLGKVLLQLNMHCFTYRCSECCRHYNECYCYCETCRTSLRFCRQLYFDQHSMTEVDLEDIVPMTN